MILLLIKPVGFFENLLRLLAKLWIIKSASAQIHHRHAPIYFTGRKDRTPYIFINRKKNIDRRAGCVGNISKKGVKK
jgi:hypothetical protein